MKKCICVLLICGALFMFVLMIGGCGSDVEADVTGSVEVEGAELLDSVVEEHALETQAQEAAQRPRREPREVPRREGPDTSAQGAGEQAAPELPEREQLSRRLSDLPPAPPVDPTGVWGGALEEYLAQYLPIFHNARHIEGVFDSIWLGNWSDFVERLPDDSGGRIWPQVYGTYFVFSDPMTGQRIEIDDAPFLTQRSGVLYDFYGVECIWTEVYIAHYFRLLYLDDSGIPYLVINWAVAPCVHYPGNLTTLHRFRDGAFEFVDDLSLWGGISFYRAEDGRLFIFHGSTVAGWIDLRSFRINDNGRIASAPALSIDGWPGTIINHLTGDEFLRYCPETNSMISREYGEYWENLGCARTFVQAQLSYYLGVPITRIDTQENVQEDLMERISRRLRDEGLVG